MQITVSTSTIARRRWVAWLALCVLAGAVCAVRAQTSEQPAAPADRTRAGGPQQQRRAALRAALQAQREADAPKTDRAMRQLTPAERAKLREQLRQQRREAPPDRNGQSPSTF